MSIYTSLVKAGPWIALGYRWHLVSVEPSVLQRLASIMAFGLEQHG